MSRYHINPETGNASVCSAKPGNCRFGEKSLHFDSLESAQAYYEIEQKIMMFPSIKVVRNNKTVTLLETIHGSHLYGLSKPTSDIDYYRVVMEDGSDPKYFSKSKQIKTRQKMDGDQDVLESSLTDFLVKADEGVPQALEAMFSSFSKGPLDDFRNSYYLNTPNFANTYRRTISNFARLGIEDERAKDILFPSKEEVSKKRVKESVRVAKPNRVERNGMLKYRRHSIRLLLNLQEGLEKGRFNPTLNSSQKSFVIKAADLEDMKFAIFIKTQFM